MGFRRLFILQNVKKKIKNNVKNNVNCKKYSQLVAYGQLVTGKYRKNDSDNKMLYVLIIRQH